jgi:hypothetical protein
MGKLKKYGLTEQEYTNLINYKGNRCWICGRPPKNKALSIEHNHVWEKSLAKRNMPIKISIRGLACFQCNNKIIGRTGDRQNAIQLFKNVVRYLEEAEERYNSNKSIV